MCTEQRVQKGRSLSVFVQSVAISEGVESQRGEAKRSLALQLLRMSGPWTHPPPVLNEVRQRDGGKAGLLSPRPCRGDAGPGEKHRALGWRHSRARSQVGARPCSGPWVCARDWDSPVGADLAGPLPKLGLEEEGLRAASCPL